MWKGGGRDVLSSNVASRIESKVLVDKRVLGGRREDILLFVVTILGFVSGDVGEELKVIGGSGGDGGTGDNVGGRVGDVKEGVVFWVVKSGPDKFWRWGARRGSDRRWEAIGEGVRAGVIPGVKVRIENFKDGGGGVGDVLLINVIKSRPRSDGDLGKGGGGDDGGLRSVERHLFKQLAPL